MPLNGLPLTLEKTLAQLIEDNELKSWNIFGKESFTQVIIRFNMDSSADLNSDIKYKKATPSQQMRDRNRVHRLRKNKEEQMDNYNDTKSNSDSPISPKSIVAESCISNHSDNIGQAIGSELDSSKVDIDPCVGSGQDSDIDSGGQNVNNLGDSTVEIKCNECDGCVGPYEWMKCTVCEDYDLCNDCSIKGTHRHHKGHLQKFIAPTNPERGYCNFCGMQFHPERNWFGVYYCAECEDYAICLKCRGFGEHYQNIPYMNRIQLGEYLLIVKLTVLFRMLEEDDVSAVIWTMRMNTGMRQKIYSCLHIINYIL